MSSSSHKQSKDKISKIFFLIGVIIGGIGVASSIVTLFPQLPEEFVSFLRSMTVALLFACVILIFLAASFWCCERLKRIKALIRDSEKMKDALISVNENLMTVSNMQIECQRFTDHTSDALQTMQAQLDRIKDDMHRKSHFEYHTATVTKLLEDYVQSHANEITEVHIVCFGRNTYEQAINFIAAKCRNITVKVIFCNAEKNKVICREDDDRKIREKIKELLNKHPERNNKIEIFVSDIPPTIRASIVYAGKMEAVWGAIQSYNFEREDERLTLVRPENSLCVVADEACEKNDFKKIIECIEKELKRLGSSANKKASLTDGKVTFIDAEWSGSE